MKTISSLACSASIAACLATSHAYADNQQDAALLKLLQEKGIISAEEAQSLQAEQARRAQQQATVSMGSKGLKIESADKQASIQIGGRLHADYATHDHEAFANQEDAIDGTQIRRARLYAKGKLNGRWKYVLESDFAGNKVSVKDANLSYKLTSAPITLTVGNQKHAVSMEALTTLCSPSVHWLLRSPRPTLTAPLASQQRAVAATGTLRPVCLATAFLIMMPMKATVLAHARASPRF
jgi:phosphate-selective porin OprO/OprP